MVEQSSKHGPAKDDVLARRPEQPEPDVAFVDEVRAPDGMSAMDVEERFELARFLGRSAFPGDREQLVQVAVRNAAPSEVIDLFRTLPPGETFTSMQDLAQAIGLGTERRRS